MPCPKKKRPKHKDTFAVVTLYYATFHSRLVDSAVFKPLSLCTLWPNVVDNDRKNMADVT